MGASRTTQRTNTSIVSVTALKKPSSVVRAAAGLFPIASANKRVKMISGSIAPLAAAFTGLVGTSDVSQLAKPTFGASVVSDCAASVAPGGSEGLTLIRCGSHAKRAIASGIMISVATVSMLMKTARVRPPRRPTALTPDADATPVITRETTSGITVIRIAFTQSVPTGAIASAALSSVGLCEAAIAMPTPRPAPSPKRTCVLSFIRSLHHEVAAIDVQGRTGDVAGSFGRDKADQIGNLDGRAEPRDGIALSQAFENLGGGAFPSQFGVDHSRADGVHGYAERAQLLCRRASET